LSPAIGLAIALCAARDGADVAITAKTAEQYPTLKGTIFTAAEEVCVTGGNHRVTRAVEAADCFQGCIVRKALAAAVDAMPATNRSTRIATQAKWACGRFVEGDRTIVGET